MVGLFGGSFDPVHHGHLIVAQAAVEALGLEELRFVPAREQPFKKGSHLAPVEDRVAMLRLAIAGASGFTVETAEADRPGPSYTVETVQILREREPGREFILLLGADAAADLPRWREAEQLLRLARVAVVARPGSPIPAAPWVSAVVPAPAIDISATDLRRRVAAGRPIRFYVPDAVATFVAEHGLYRND